MKKTKILLLAVLLIAVMAVFAGCGAKTALTADDFIAVAESNGLEIYDDIEMYGTGGAVESALTAHCSDGWGIQFYVISSESKAKSLFNDNKISFESFKGKSASESSGSGENYSYYSLTNGDSYMYICRIDNTILLADNLKSTKADVKSMIKKFGY